MFSRHITYVMMKNLGQNVNFQISAHYFMDPFVGYTFWRGTTDFVTSDIFNIKNKCW